jgi:hypothetical protein
MAKPPDAPTSGPTNTPSLGPFGPFPYGPAAPPNGPLPPTPPNPLFPFPNSFPPISPPFFPPAPPSRPTAPPPRPGNEIGSVARFRSSMSNDAAALAFIRALGSLGDVFKPR